MASRVTGHASASMKTVGMAQLFLALLEGDVLAPRRHAFVRGTDDLAVVREFFDTVRAPADRSRAREQRGVELLGNAQHPVDVPGVEVHVGAHALVDGPRLGDRAWRDL